MRGQEVALVGGGNSAGQATVFLASRARQVTLIARRPLTETMSQYLIERIEAQPNVEVVIGCEVSALEGADGELDAITWRNRASGKRDGAARCATCSPSSARSRTPTGCGTPASSSTSAASS